MEQKYFDTITSEEEEENIVMVQNLKRKERSKEEIKTITNVTSETKFKKRKKHERYNKYMSADEIEAGIKNKEVVIGKLQRDKDFYITTTTNTKIMIKN